MNCFIDIITDIKRYDSNGHSNGEIRFYDMVDPIKLRWELNSKVNIQFLSFFLLYLKFIFIFIFLK